MMTTATGKALYQITHTPFYTVKTVTYLFSSLPAVKVSLSFNKIKEHSKLVSIWSLLCISGFMMSIFQGILFYCQQHPHARFLTAAKY